MNGRERADVNCSLRAAVGCVLASLSLLAQAGFLAEPELARPGAARPPAVAPEKEPAAPPGAAATSLAEALAPGPDSLAQVMDLPPAARPGAVRPGENRKLEPQAPPAELVPESVANYDVPPVVDRPLDIDEGERIAVNRFLVEGAQDRPEHDITIAAVQALVDERLAARPDGFTVGRLQEVADELTKYYRDHGLILAQAFIPVQSVEDGAVRIQVMEGLLGRVVTEGNDMYAAEVLERPFAGLVGEPVTKEDIEAALLRVSDLPGQSSFGVFQPGVQVGTADMVIKVQEEDRFEFAARADNHGISETGQNRYLGQGTVNDPLGLGDRFSVTAQHTAVPDNTFFYAVDYQVPVQGFYDTVFGIGMNRNQFDVGGEFRDADIASDIRNYNASLTKSFIRGRLLNLSTTARISKKRSGTKAAGRRVNLDSLAVAALEVNFDSVDSRFGGLNAGYLEISHGFNDLFGAMGANPASIQPTRQGGTGRFAEGKFDKVLLSLSRFQALSPLWDKLASHNLLFSFELQYSPDLLVPLEQYTVGGPNNVRGYRPTESLFDRAVFGSVEWIINAPFISDQPAFGNRTWGELLQLSFFYDMAAGKLNSSLPTETESENYKSVGFALSFNNPKVFSSKITIATPIGRPEPENDKHPQYWVDLNFFF